MKTWTDAPVVYDGFGTKTVKVVALIASPMGRRIVRIVETPEEHVNWQRMRYGSGMYLNASEDQVVNIQGMFEPLYGKCPLCQYLMETEGHVCPTEEEKEIAQKLISECAEIEEQIGLKELDGG